MKEEIYPLSLYRSGAAFEWDGRPTDSCVVNDEGEHLTAAEEGWLEAADYFAEVDQPKKRGRSRRAQEIMNADAD